VGEVGQHVVAASVQGAPEDRQLLQPGRDAYPDGADHAGEQGLALVRVGVRVGGDDLLANPVGDLD
jgi:hypothetical protein